MNCVNGKVWFNNYMNFLLLIMFLFINTYSFSLRRTTKNILYLTDIHLDILYDSNSPITGKFITRCKNNDNLEIHSIRSFDYGRYSCNANENLIKETVEDVKKKFNEIEAVIISGDQIAHGLYDLDFKKSKEENKFLYRRTFTKIFNIIKEAFPSATIIPTVGNNDFYEHYDFPDENSKQEQINFLKSLYFDKIDSYNFNSDFNETITKGFYYSQFEPNLNVKFIILNTVMFSLKNKNKAFSDEIAHKQINFLERELEKASHEGKSVILVFHIPPFPNYVNNTVEFFYYEEFTHSFEKIIYNHKDIIINIFTGHLHSAKIGIRSKMVAKFQTQFDSNTLFDFLPRMVLLENYFASVSFPSLTPVFTNNPGYSIIKFNPEFLKIEDIEIHYADLRQTLNEDMTFSKDIQIAPENFFSTIYSFRRDFGFLHFDNQDFNNFMTQRMNDEITLKNYQMLIMGGKKNASGNERQYFIDLLKRLGMIDLENGCKMLKCINKIFYQTEVELC